MLRIKQEREKKGITQQELAFRSGVSMRTIAYLETNGRDARVGTVTQIAKALGVPFSRLLEKS